MTEAEQGLLYNIVQDPLDDTARLVYADWLDEHPHVESRQCGMCVDGKCTDMNIGDIRCNEWDCQSCMGKGYITEEDVGRNEAKAEFIRLQIDIATNRISCPKCENTGDWIGVGICNCVFGLCKTILSKWTNQFVGGDSCSGCNWRSKSVACICCLSTRYSQYELLAQRTRDGVHFNEIGLCSQLAPEFHRGFIDRVTIPNLHPDGKTWFTGLNKIVKNYPISRIKVMGIKPVQVVEPNGNWFLMNADRDDTRPTWEGNHSLVPTPLYDEVEILANGRITGSMYTIFKTEKEAVSCLERAAANLVRVQNKFPRMTTYKDLM